MTNNNCTCICSNWHGGSAVYIADRNCPTHGDIARLAAAAARKLAPRAGRIGMTHTLKTWPEPFDAVNLLDKTFEIRKDDRNYQLGDRLILQEWIPETETYTGREIEFRVTFIGRGAPYPEGYACMSIQEIER